MQKSTKTTKIAMQVFYAYFPRMLRILLMAYIVRILRAYSSHMLRIILVYVTRILACVTRVLRACYAYSILRKCSRRGVVAPFPPIFRQNIFTMHFWNVNSNHVTDSTVYNACRQITIVESVKNFLKILINIVMIFTKICLNFTSYLAGAYLILTSKTH